MGRTGRIALVLPSFVIEKSLPYVLVKYDKSIIFVFVLWEKQRPRRSFLSGQVSRPFRF